MTIKSFFDGNGDGPERDALIQVVLKPKEGKLSLLRSLKKLLAISTQVIFRLM